MKIINNFEQLKKSIVENKSRWLLKCLAFKQFRTTVSREYTLTNAELADRIDVLNKLVI